MARRYSKRLLGIDPSTIFVDKDNNNMANISVDNDELLAEYSTYEGSGDPDLGENPETHNEAGASYDVPPDSEAGASEPELDYEEAVEEDVSSDTNSNIVPIPVGVVTSSRVTSTV